MIASTFKLPSGFPRRTKCLVVSITLCIVLLTVLPSFGQIVIGNFEGGSLDGFTDQEQSISAITGGPGNTVGTSSLDVTLIGGFWGWRKNDVSTADFLDPDSNFLLADLTFVNEDLPDATFAQTNEMAINSGLEGTFSQRVVDFDSVLPETPSQWEGMEGTRTIGWNLNSFMVTDPADSVMKTYKEYMANHSELTTVEFWMSAQSDAGLGLGHIYFDNIRLAAELPTAPAQPGDFDGDGDVDGADFVVWQTNFPTETGATLATGDADGDGDVDGADFVIWQTNFPFTPAPSSAGVAPVPEPGAVVLAGFAALALVVIGRRRRSA